MKSEKFAQTPVCDERLLVAVPAALKDRLFVVATERGLTASALVRQAITALTDEPRAA